MAKRPFHEIEELVQASVFHPSPCKRLRERVLHSAIRAQKQQIVSRRTLLGASTVLAVALILFIVLSWNSSPPTDARPSPPRDEPPSTRPVRPATQERVNSLSPHHSLGQALLHGKVSSL
jgi:hypothetical protein